MMRIGDFSRLSRVPVKTLRYYDELGLIKPAQVDEFTGYRYYAYEQYFRLNRILALRDLGFSLEQIGALLEDGLSAQKMRAMLVQRQAQAMERLAEEQGRLARLEAWISQLEREDSMVSYEVVVKKVAPQRVASVRGIVPQPGEQGVLWGRLMPYLERKGVKVAGPCITVYHDEEAPERDWDIEVLAPIDADLPAEDGVRVYELPGAETMACTVHEGPWATVSEAYAALTQWTGQHGYELAGHPREVILRMAQPRADGNVSQTDANGVAEIQFPVRKV
jgi:DNA-binding transcriptional MerR regulator